MRQYFPKGTDLSRWNVEDIAAIAHTLNTRPRKTLGWRTPDEALTTYTRFNKPVLRPSIESAQYSAHDLAAAAAAHGLRRSMGATGVWDNAGAESLWSTFKHEYYYRHTFRMKTELIAAVDNWMHFVKRKRRHSTIGMHSPLTYEHTLKAT